MNEKEFIRLSEEIENDELLKDRGSIYLTINGHYTATVRNLNAVDIVQKMVDKNETDENFGRIVMNEADETLTNAVKEMVSGVYRRNLAKWYEYGKYTNKYPEDTHTPTGRRLHGVLWWYFDDPPAEEIQVGDVIEIHRNQAFREAEVLAVIDHEAFVQYEMPKGAVYHNVVDIKHTFDRFSKLKEYPNYKTVSVYNIPKKWKEALTKEDTLAEVESLRHDYYS